MKCNNCGSERAIGSGGSSVPTKIRCPDCGFVQTYSNIIENKTRKTFNLKELFIWHKAVELEIFSMETYIPKGIEACLQYNEERAKERLEKIKSSQEYKNLVKLKEKIESIEITINFEKESDNEA